MLLAWFHNVCIMYNKFSITRRFLKTGMVKGKSEREREREWEKCESYRETTRIVGFNFTTSSYNLFLSRLAVVLVKTFVEWELGILYETSNLTTSIILTRKYVCHLLISFWLFFFFWFTDLHVIIKIYVYWNL